MRGKHQLVILSLLICVCVPFRCSASAASIAAVVKQGPNGQVEFTVINNYRQPITAMVLVIRGVPLDAGARRFVTTRYSDSLLDPWRNKPIQPRESRTFVFGGTKLGPSVLRYEPKLSAAIFEDGASFGDPQVVEEIVAGRKTFFVELGKAISILQSAQATSASRSEVLQQAEELEKSEMPASPTVEERRAVGNVFGTIRANLQRTHGIPLSRTEQAILGMYLNLRQALLSSKPSVAPLGQGVNPPNP